VLPLASKESAPQTRPDVPGGIQNFHYECRARGDRAAPTCDTSVPVGGPPFPIAPPSGRRLLLGLRPSVCTLKELW
jgi:hypothetical protein